MFFEGKPRRGGIGGIGGGKGGLSVLDSGYLNGEFSITPAPLSSGDGPSGSSMSSSESAGGGGESGSAMSFSSSGICMDENH